MDHSIEARGIDVASTYFSSDQHFGHTTAVLDKPGGGWHKSRRAQFATVDAMEQAMVDAWNLEVESTDTVYVLGDFVYMGSSASREQIIDHVGGTLGRLAGNKILVVGNHDLPFDDRSTDGDYIEAGFSEVIHGKLPLDLDGLAMDASHFGRFAREYDTRFADVHEALNDSPDTWRLHGHTHDRTQMRPASREFHIGVDAWSFRPVAAERIVGMVAEVESIRCE